MVSVGDDNLPATLLDPAVVGSVLCVMRRNAHISQKQLADRLNTSPSWVARREHGQARIEVMDFINWCAACHTKPETGMEWLLQAISPSKA